MPDRISSDRIRTAEPTVDTIAPGTRFYISIYSLYVGENQTLRVLRSARVLTAESDKTDVLIGRSRDGTLWVDIRSQPDYKFKNDLSGKLSGDFTDLFFTIDDIIT
jgi:hypothetical protein